MPCCIPQAFGVVGDVHAIFCILIDRGLVLILAGADCVVWDFFLVQVYARVDLYLFSTVTQGRLARKPFGYYILCYTCMLHNKKPLF
jgi:hypothetical protein